MRLRAPEERARDASTASSSAASNAGQARAPLSTALDLPRQLPAADPNQEELAARSRSGTTGSGEVDGEVQTDPSGLDRIRAAALQKPIDVLIRRDPQGPHLMRVILNRSIVLGVRG